MLRLWSVFLVPLTLENVDSSFHVQTGSHTICEPFLQCQGTRRIPRPAPAPRPHPADLTREALTQRSAAGHVGGLLVRPAFPAPALRSCATHGSAIRCKGKYRLTGDLESSEPSVHSGGPAFSWVFRPGRRKVSSDRPGEAAVTALFLRFLSRPQVRRLRRREVRAGLQPDLPMEEGKMGCREQDLRPALPAAHTPSPEAAAAASPSTSGRGGSAE